MDINHGYLTKLKLFGLSLFFIGFMGILAGCGGGSGGGGSAPTASSVAGIYTGGNTIASIYFPNFLRSAYASTTAPSPTSFTFTLNSTGQFSIADNVGDIGSGTYSLSGSSVTVTGGTFVVNSKNCTQSTSNSNCLYTISASNGGLTVSGTNIAGTLNFNNSTTGSSFSVQLGVSVNTLPTITLTQLEGKTATQIFGTVSNPNPSGVPPYNCTSADMIAGTTGLTVNGSTMYFPCISWNTYQDGSMGPNNNSDANVCPGSPSSQTFYPCNGTASKIVFCPTLGATCYPSTSSLPTFINNPHFPPLTVPSNALAFYQIATICPSTSCSGGGANGGGYIVPAAGANGGVIGKMFWESTYCNSNNTGSGTMSAIVSTSGSLTGTYFYGSTMPDQATYNCGGTVYHNYPASFVFYTTTQY